MTATSTPVLHMVCGKIGAGKSTLTKQLAAAPGTVLISEDAWLAELYPGEIRELPDYVRCAGRLKQAMAPHVSDLLRAGASVVLDFPANTVASRQWMRGIFEAAGAAHALHFLDVPDAVCKERLRARNASGTHPFETTDEQFELITSHFAAPSPQEGFDVVRHA
ncbi:UNVERIFIED_ORG: putative kinase [Variovorax paradoxus]|nr:putative kinase [Variovorax paradoxus]